MNNDESKEDCVRTAVGCHDKLNGLLGDTLSDKPSVQTEEHESAIVIVEERSDDEFQSGEDDAEKSEYENHRLICSGDSPDMEYGEIDEEAIGDGGDAEAELDDSVGELVEAEHTCELMLLSVVISLTILSGNEVPIHPCYQFSYQFVRLLSRPDYLRKISSLAFSSVLNQLLLEHQS